MKVSARSAAIHRYLTDTRKTWRPDVSDDPHPHFRPHRRKPDPDAGHAVMGVPPGFNPHEEPDPPFEQPAVADAATDVSADASPEASTDDLTETEEARNDTTA